MLHSYGYMLEDVTQLKSAWRMWHEAYTTWLIHATVGTSLTWIHFGVLPDISENDLTVSWVISNWWRDHEKASLRALAQKHEKVIDNWVEKLKERFPEKAASPFAVGTILRDKTGNHGCKYSRNVVKADATHVWLKGPDLCRSKRLKVRWNGKQPYVRERIAAEDIVPWEKEFPYVILS